MTFKERLRANRRLIIVCALIAGICFVVGALTSSQMPKIRSLILVKIEQETRDRLPLRVLPGSVEVSFIPLGATLHDVKIVPQKELIGMLEKAELANVSVYISPWQLLRGRIRLSEIALDGADLAITIPPIKKRSTSNPLDGLFDMLSQIPVNQIALSDVSARLTFMDPKMTIQISDVDLYAGKRRGNSYTLDLNSASVQILQTDASAQPSLKVDLEAGAALTKDAFDLSILKIRRGDSYLSASGNFRGDIEKMNFKDIEMHAKTDLLLESMGTWASKVFPEQFAKLPQLRGRAVIDAKLRRLNGQDPIAEFEAHTDKLQVAKIFADKISTSGKVFVHKEKAEIQLPKVTLDNPAGIIEAENVMLSLSDAKPFSGTIKTGNLQLHELLRSLGAGKGEIPVFLQASGELPCSGTIQPVALSCKGHIKGENLLVRSSMESKGTVVAVREIEASGDMTLNKESITYRADLKAPNSTGHSDGTIKFDEGFKINYESDKLAIADITNLADLKLEGSTRVKGSTEGSTEYGTINMDIDATDVWLEDFWLGNAKANMAYKSGTLTFANLAGYYTVSRYSGDVKIDVDKREINANVKTPFFDAHDLLKVFSHKVQLPFTVTGTGQAQAKVSGPLALGKLTYDLKSSLYKGTVWTESFDQAFFDVKSVKGEVKAERVLMQKGTGLVQLTGVAHPDGSIKTIVQGKNLKLEDSVIVARSGLSLSGGVDFDMDMAGFVLTPDTDMRGHVTKTAIGDQAVPDSTYELQFSKKDVQGNASLLGDAVKTSFKVPFDENVPFALKVKSKDWNYAPLFAAIAGPASRKDYQGNLTIDVDLASQTGGFWNATGAMHVEDFELSHGTLAMRSTEPLSVTMKNGQVHVDKFNLSGENLFLKIVDVPKPTSKVDLQVNGKIDMTLLALLMPFFEDLRGLLSFAFNVKAGPGTADVLGSAYIEKGYVKFFDFPHAFEDIRIDLLFNQKKILFNTVKAEFGGGRITATGGMELKGYKNYPVDVSGQFDRISMNLPDKVRTTGSGNFTFTGNWFPFLLKGNYDVKDGLVSKDFGGGSEQEAATIRRDQFLPEMLVKDRFIPMLIDLDIGFTKGLQVRNENTDGKVYGQFNAKGNPVKPTLLGSFTLEKDTKITVKDTVFEVTNATIQLDSPNDINPKLYIVAHARVQEYEVSLVVQGTGNKPEFTFGSVPTLAQKDIISLLAVGTTDQQSANPVTQYYQQNHRSRTRRPLFLARVRSRTIRSAKRSNRKLDLICSLLRPRRKRINPENPDPP